MGHPLSLSFHLAAGARAERAQRKALARDRRGDDPMRPELEDLRREQLGEATQPRPDGPLLWVHSGRDRHALAARELTHRLRLERPDLQLLFTTSADRHPPPEPDAAVQLAPVESLAAIRRFLGHWRPDCALWTEADARPALAAEAAARNIPLYLVDARTSRPVLPRWRPWPRPASNVLAPFRRILTGDTASAAALRRLGAAPDRIETPGYLEEGTAALPCNTAERDELSRELSGRPVWLASRATGDELPAILDTQRAALRQSHRLLLILTPDDPADGPAWMDIASDQGFIAGLRSTGAEPEHDTQIYIADTEDEMGLWYRLAAISFLGKSRTGGGTNPFEAAALGSAILHGPNIRNYRSAYARLEQVGAARPVRNADQMADTLTEMLAPDLAATMAHAGWAACSAGAEVTDRAMDLLLAELDRMPGA